MTAARADIVIRSLGDRVVVIMEIGGIRRGIKFTAEAVKDYLELSSEDAAALSNDERCELVLENLDGFVALAWRQLATGDPYREVIIVQASDVPSRRGRSGRTRIH
jgi:hypothetical protein